MNSSADEAVRHVDAGRCAHGRCRRQGLISRAPTSNADWLRFDADGRARAGLVRQAASSESSEAS
eukprot:9499994-Pyramimonas_sp.AAC.2